VIAVGFFDAGDSYNHLRDFKLSKIQKGIGSWDQDSQVPSDSSL